MTTTLSQHCGFRIAVTSYRSGKGFEPTVVITKDGSSGTDIRLTPPRPDRGFETEGKAFAAGRDYAIAAIDGRFPGIDVSKL